MEFEPYTLGPNKWINFFFFGLKTVVHLNFFPDKYERELIKLSDGGTIGLDWDGGFPDKRDKNMKPILCLFNGIAGHNQNLNVSCMVEYGRCAGFKVV